MMIGLLCFNRQRAVFKYFPELHDFAMSNIASIDTREALLQHFGSLS